MQENTFSDWFARQNSAAATTDAATTDTGSTTPGGDAFQKYIEQQKKTTEEAVRDQKRLGKGVTDALSDKTGWKPAVASVVARTAGRILPGSPVAVGFGYNDRASFETPTSQEETKAYIQGLHNKGKQAVDAFHAGDYKGAARHTADALAQYFGMEEPVQQIEKRIDAGDSRGAAGYGLGLLTQAAATLGLNKLMGWAGTKYDNSQPSLTNVKEALSTTHDVYRVGKSIATGDPRGIAPAIRLVNKVKGLTRSTPEAESIALAKAHLAEVRRIMDQQGDPQDSIRPGARDAGTPGYVPKFLDSKPPIIAPDDTAASPAPDGIKLTPMRLTHPPENGVPPEAAAPPDNIFSQYELELLGQGKLNFRAPEAPPASPPADGIRLTPMSLTHPPENFAQPVEEPPAPVPSQHDLELAGQGRLNLVTPSVQPPPAPVVPRGDGFALTHPPEITPVAEPEPTPQPVSSQELELAGQRILPGVGPKHTEWIPPQPKPEGPAGHVPDYQYPLPGPDRFAELIAAQKQAEMEYAKAILEQRAKREATPLTKPDTASQPADTQPAVTATPPAAEASPAATTPAATPKGKGKPKPPQKPLKAVVEETVAPDKSEPLDLESLIQQSLTEERIRAMRIRAAMGDSPVVSHDNQALNNELEARAGEDHQLYRAMTIDENAAALYKYLKSKGFKYEHVSKMMGDADFANWEMIAKEAQVPTPSKSVRVAVQKLMKKKV